MTYERLKWSLTLPPPPSGRQQKEEPEKAVVLSQISDVKARLLGPVVLAGWGSVPQGHLVVFGEF